MLSVSKGSAHVQGRLQCRLFCVLLCHSAQHALGMAAMHPTRCVRFDQVSPEVRVLQMDPVTRTITPTEFEGVKLVSFGWAGQGSAIMRGPMVSGAPWDGNARSKHPMALAV